MRLFALLPFLLFLVACDPRPEQKQAASDAMAGTEALTDPDLEKEDAPIVKEGVKVNIETAVGVRRDELPPPKTPPKKIVENPQPYLDDAKKNQNDYFSSTGFWSWIGGGTLALLGILRFIPGAHQPIVGFVQTLLENKLDRSARQKKEGLVDAAKVMIEVVESLPPETGKSIKDAIAKKLPSAANDAVKAWLAEQEA